MRSEEEIFSQFRPLCTILRCGPNTEALARLGQLCDKAEARDLEMVQTWLMLPAQEHLQTRARASPQNYTIAILDYIRSLYKRIRLTDLFLFSDVLKWCLVLMTPETNNSVTVTEDLPISFCDTLRTMIRASRDSDVIEDDREGAGVIFTHLMASAEPSLKLPLSQLVATSLAWASEDAAPASVVLACIR